MLIVKIFGGLGNQMFQYAFYEFLKKNNDNVYIDISDFEIHKHHTGYELKRVFQVDANVANKEMIRKIAINSNSICTRFIRKLCGIDIRKIGECKAHYHFINIRSQKIYQDIYFDGYWQNVDYLEPVREELEQVFQYRNILTGKNKKLQNFIKENECVALHVRRGDYLNNNSLSSVCGIEYYRKAIGYIINKIDRKITFVVFSDDIKWARENLPLPEDSIYVDWNTGEDSYMDMQLMDMCKHSIIANSTFSWWPAWLKSSRNDCIIIMPEKWFANEGSERLNIKGSIRL